MDAAMISTTSYAEKYGFPVSTVRSWAERGRIPGVQKIPNASTGHVYLIPEDALPIRRKAGRPKADIGIPEQLPSNVTPHGTAKRKRTNREISLFIRQHCNTMTYGQIAMALDMTTLEVRAVYERLHKRYGI